MPDDPIDISAIIVSYNTREMTLECLRTLHTDLAGTRAEIFVVDNASTDNSADAIRDAFPHAIVIANTQNAGFGAANNQAMAQARGRYLLLLNSDAFVKPGAVQALVAYLDAHPKTAIAGPRLLNKDGSLQVSCFRYPSPGRAWCENLWLSTLFRTHGRIGDYRRWPHDREREVDWVIGACLLVRREAYARVGGFDERFFMYAEETDWQARIRDAGWKIAFTPAAQVTHLGGASGSAGPNPHFFESLDRYEYKHHGATGLISLRTAMTIGCSARLVLWLLMLILRPAKCELAMAKARLCAWLIKRQLTHWSVLMNPAERSVPS